MLDPKSIYRKSVFAKCTRLACFFWGGGERCIVLSLRDRLLWWTQSSKLCSLPRGKRLLKGLFTIFLFSVRSHILKDNGVWYCWFCPEGPINASNSKILVFNFVPRDLDSQHHMGPRLAAPRTSTSSAKGPWLAAPIVNDPFKEESLVVTPASVLLWGGRGSKKEWIWSTAGQKVGIFVLVLQL